MGVLRLIVKGDNGAKTAVNIPNGSDMTQEQIQAVVREKLPEIEQASGTQLVDRAKEWGASDRPWWHGSTHDIREMDASRASKEGDWGQGIYASDTLDDVNANYAGVGPDLTGRIARQAEEIGEDLARDDFALREAIEDLADDPEFLEVLDENDWSLDEMVSSLDGDPDSAIELVSEHLARKELMGENQGTVYPLRIDESKYATIGEDGTIWRPDPDNMQGYDTQYEEVADALGQALRDTDLYQDESAIFNIMDGVQEMMMDGELDITELDYVIRQNATMAYDDMGEMVSPGGISSQVLKNLGYEGVIDKQAGAKFGPGRQFGTAMEGMRRDTTHAVTFPDGEHNIRSVNAEFDPAKKRSRDILAGLGGAAVVGGAATGSEEAEARVPFSRFMKGAEIDPRFDKRVGEQAKIQGLRTEADSFLPEVDQVTLADMEGRGFVTGMADRTAAAEILRAIKEVELNSPIDLRGGQDYMFDPRRLGQTWASAPKPVKDIVNLALEMKRQTGKDPIWLPWIMAPTGGDFATMTGEAMLGYAQASMTKAQKRALNRAIKDFRTTGNMVKGKRVNAGLKADNWPGIDDPTAVQNFQSMPDALRKELKNMMDVKFRREGGLGIGEARLAVTDPKQLNSPVGSVMNVGEIHPDSPIITNSGHIDYPYGVPGQGVGRLPEDGRPLVTDLLRGQATRWDGPSQSWVTDDWVGDKGVPFGQLDNQTRRSLEVKPYGGIITDQNLSALRKHGYQTGMIDPRLLAAMGLTAAGLAAMAPQDAEAAVTKAYKLFRRKKGDDEGLYPLFVDANTPVKQGSWVDAIAGDLNDKGKVKSKIGPLAYRPGWHAGDLPVATHIGGKSDPALKAPDYRPDDQVWAEIEMRDDVDWQSIADSRAQLNKAGEPIPRTAHITDQIPKGGHYRYKTNPNMTGEWLIGGEMKVNRVLDNAEVQQINDAAGVADLPRYTPLKGLGAAAPVAAAGAAALAPEEAEASRLARAAELGYNKPLYHSTPEVFDEFDMDKVDLGVHMGTPEQAAIRSDRIDRDRQYYGKAPGTPNTMPLLARQGGILEMDDVGAWNDSFRVLEHLKGQPGALGEHAQKYFDETWDTRMSYGDLDEWLESPENREFLDEIRDLMLEEGYDTVKYRNAVENMHGMSASERPENAAKRDKLWAERQAVFDAEKARRPKTSLQRRLDELWEDPDVTQEQVNDALSNPLYNDAAEYTPQYTDAEREVIDRVEREMAELDEIQLEDSMSYIALDPANIRSRNAQFNPENEGNAQLLGGLGAGAVGLAAAGGSEAALSPEEAEASVFNAAQFGDIPIGNPAYRQAEEDLARDISAQLQENRRYGEAQADLQEKTADQLEVPRVKQLMDEMGPGAYFSGLAGLGEAMGRGLLGAGIGGLHALADLAVNRDIDSAIGKIDDWTNALVQDAEPNPNTAGSMEVLIAQYDSLPPRLQELVDMYMAGGEPAGGWVTDTASEMGAPAEVAGGLGAATQSVIDIFAP